MFGSDFTTFIIYKEEMNDIMKTVNFLRENGLSIKDISETIKNKVKNKKERFLECY